MKKYFITGLLVLVPLFITAWVLSGIIGMMDKSLLLLPMNWRPKAQLGLDIPGMGAILTLLIIFITGVIATNIFGKQLILIWEKMLNRVPVVKSIYASVKQVSDTLFSDSGNAFRQAVLVQFPREGAWTIAFVTGQPGGDVANHLKGDFVSVYVPTTPNPTGGYFLMMPSADVKALDMSVDEALKYIISMGVVAPAFKAPVAPALKETLNHLH
ncbi:MAG: DUF502 domain-containing protein [Methylotenera sp.]|nr:DUF502 domain-containing protein [Methylotenera sp.]